ncbi:hypothetical protein [Pontibacter ramchanderi]|uniref:6-bladed beta-propeller protein n=1 Tax=Pontibacter ramchanderi TaxID=1179743 RepID=A0A2N3UB37_9BACT|nr:hypothetical protein [Pontibacter ramchanderi]PKV66610.1 hypothetical protein BD749_1740 [Pontibacter ramchanderi]
MAKTLNSNILSSKLYLSTALYLLLTLLALPAAAQQPDSSVTLTYNHSLPISSPAAVSVARNGNVYLMDPSQNLFVLDTTGKPVNTFSPPSRGRISAVEAWNPMKVFLFYEDRQELTLLDRFMRPIANTRLTDLGYMGNVQAATLTSDDSFWLFNESDFTLSKLDLRYQKPIIETPLNLILDKARFDVRFIREYQNMVYLLDYNSGVYVFDNLGNYKKKLPFTGVSYIAFGGNELYFVKNNVLHFFDLYKLQERSLPLPSDKTYLSALISNNLLYLLSKEQADVYRLSR